MSTFYTDDELREMVGKMTAEQAWQHVEAGLIDREQYRRVMEEYSKECYAIADQKLKEMGVHDTLKEYDERKKEVKK